MAGPIKQGTYYTVHQLAPLVGLSEQAVRRKIRQGRLKARKLANAYEIKGEWITQWLASCETRQ